MSVYIVTPRIGEGLRRRVPRKLQVQHPKAHRAQVQLALVGQRATVQPPDAVIGNSPVPQIERSALGSAPSVSQLGLAHISNPHG
jgi:hypothetical protein